VHLSTEDFDYDTYIGDGEVVSHASKEPYCAAKENFMEGRRLQTNCDKWAALPTGGVSAYFAQQAHHKTDAS
jgi:hypothetical protein